MRKFIPVVVVCVIAAFAGSFARGQDRLERARGDLDDARRRESDISGAITEQERTNALLRQQIRKAEDDPRGLEKDLVDASAKAAALRQKVAEQKARRDAAADKYETARGQALEKYEDTDAMRAGRRALDSAAQELDRLSQPIIDQLAQTQAYQEAQALVEAAAQTGEALQGFRDVDPKAQADADAAFEQASARVREMEDAAVNADPQARVAFKSFRDAQDRLDGVQRDNERRIAADPAVDGARFALDLEERLLDDATASLSSAEKRVSALRQVTVPGAGPGALAAQLKEGEERLRDLNDQLDQARVARRDAEDRLRFAEDAVADGRRPATSGEPYVAPPPPPSYDPGYDSYDYGAGGYGYSYPAYGYPYAYGYSYYGYRYYDPFYCSPFWSIGFSFGSFYHSHHWWDCHPHYAYYHHSRDDAWRSRYDYWRRHDGVHHDGDWHDGRNSTLASSRDGRRNDYTGSSRYDGARVASSGSRSRVGGDTRVSTYYYPGSTNWRLREQESARVRDYDQAVRDRRVTSGSSSTSSSSSSSVRGTARGTEERSRTQTEWRPRTSRDETEGTRPNIEIRRRGSDDSPSRSRSSESGSSGSRSGGSSSSSSSSSVRSRGSDSPPPTPPSSVSSGRSRGSSSGGSSAGSSGGGSYRGSSGGGGGGAGSAGSSGSVRSGGGGGGGGSVVSSGSSRGGGGGGGGGSSVRSGGSSSSSSSSGGGDGGGRGRR